MAGITKKPEIMAPVGDMTALDAAIKAGADAVYFGIEGMNMRAGAKNFTLRRMVSLCEWCRRANVKKYLTLNTVYFEGELAKLGRAVAAAKRAGVDAVIAWDPAVLELARAAGMEVHLSTQASAANSAAVLSYHRNFGVRRFVLAREVGLEQIRKIRSAVARELGAREASRIGFEVFAHGAMCVSVSGRCFMSLYQYGKSANRGECLQPCRREYFIHDGRPDTEGFALEKSHILSPKDLCTLPFLEKLIEAGADSLKIEGRNRNAEYVYECVSAYRRVVDFYFENRGGAAFKRDFEALKASEFARLEKVFNRGFSSGFYMGRPAGDWTSAGNEAKRRKSILGRVVNYFPKIGVAQISVDNGSLREGDEIQLEGETTGFLRFSASGMRVGGAEAACAKKGDEVSLRVPEKVRKNDRLYVFI